MAAGYRHLCHEAPSSTFRYTSRTDRIRVAVTCRYSHSASKDDFKVMRPTLTTWHGMARSRKTAIAAAAAVTQCYSSSVAESSCACMHAGGLSYTYNTPCTISSPDRIIERSTTIRHHQPRQCAVNEWHRNLDSLKTEIRLAVKPTQSLKTGSKT